MIIKYKLNEKTERRLERWTMPSIKNKKGEKQKIHSASAKFINLSAYGQLKFQCSSKTMRDPLKDPKKAPLCIEDFYKHFIVFGGSGSGKTFYILNQLLEAFFRATHLPLGKERDSKKFAMLLIEVKGDFRDKIWFLAKKYLRYNDVKFFGPTHLDMRFDPFADRTELPIQKAAKIVEMLRGFSGGKGMEDPFWENSATKLFMNIFELCDELANVAESVKEKTPEVAEKLMPQPMSFSYLNLLLMDRGQARNASEVKMSKDSLLTILKEYRLSLEEISLLCGRMMAEFNKIGRLAIEQNKLLVNEQENLSLQPGSADKEEIKKLIYQKQLVGDYTNLISYFKLDTGESVEEIQPVRVFEKIRDLIFLFLKSQDDRQRADISNKIDPFIEAVTTELLKRLTLVENIDQSALRQHIMDFSAVRDKHKSARARLISYQLITPEYGALRSLLNIYEESLKLRGIVTMQDDKLWSYFNNEYLSEANEKTSGSVSMVASVMVNMLSSYPFNVIFSPNASFDFNKAIDEGWIIYLDMPTKVYGPAADIASIALKIDFFRAVLTRKRLKKRDGSGKPGRDLVNQVRPIFYFCDEFQGTVTLGKDTGEAEFMAVAREFLCGVVLGTQSASALLSKMSEHDFNKMMANIATKWFLRNTDAPTNKMASDQTGEEIKVNATLTSSASNIFDHPKDKSQGRGFSTSYSKGAKFGNDVLTKLQDGEAIVCLPPRFLADRCKKIQFKGHPIDDPDQGFGDGVPQCLEIKNVI